MQTLNSQIIVITQGLLPAVMPGMPEVLYSSVSRLFRKKRQKNCTSCNTCRDASIIPELFLLAPVQTLRLPLLDFIIINYLITPHNIILSDKLTILH
jgi:hypothetical protein